MGQKLHLSVSSSILYMEIVSIRSHRPKPLGPLMKFTPRSIFNIASTLHLDKIDKVSSAFKEEKIQKSVSGYRTWSVISAAFPLALDH